MKRALAEDKSDNDVADAGPVRAWTSSEVISRPARPAFALGGLRRGERSRPTSFFLIAVLMRALNFDVALASFSSRLDSHSASRSCAIFSIVRPVLTD